MLIINSDDFGLNPTVNSAIVRSIELGLCSSTTLMVNMPGFEEACDLAHERRLLDHVGIHLVLRDGPPLSEAIKKSSRFCDREGRLALNGSSPVFALETSEKYALAAEIRAQVARCRQKGIFLTHLDSHYHLHTRWAILGVVIAVAQSERIPFVRMSQNCRYGNLSLRLYKYAVNRRIKGAGLSRTRYFAGIDDSLVLERAGNVAKKKQSMEVMIHAEIRDGVLIDSPCPEPLESRIASVESYDEAVSFSGAKYR